MLSVPCLCLQLPYRPSSLSAWLVIYTQKLPEGRPNCYGRKPKKKGEQSRCDGLLSLISKSYFAGLDGEFDNVLQDMEKEGIAKRSDL